jgi:hypothetical protein
MGKRIVAILGGGLKESLNRVKNAFGLLRDADILILSGGEVSEMYRLVKELGYDKRVILDKTPVDTYENAQNVKSIIGRFEDQVDEVYIATSNYHKPRTSLIFRKTFKYEPYDLRIIGLPFSPSVRELAKCIGFEVLSMLKYILSIYLHEIGRRDVYEKTIHRIKNLILGSVVG